MFRSNFKKRLAYVVAAAMGTAVVPAAAQAGFLDQLFGGGVTAPQPAPSIDYNAPSQPDDLGYSPIRPTHRAKKKVAAVDKAPKLQQTTDLMSDKTLQPGDAIMMRSGVHIYTGSESAHHDADDFVALDAARHVPKLARGQLASMDVARRAPLSLVASSEGRSAATAGPAISQGYKITDARGRSIRYVGP